jgi:hypothetical protein
MERLIQLGFNPVGNWYMMNENYLQFSFLNQNWRKKNQLYSFVVNDEIKYIGHAPNTLSLEMCNYKRPRVTQWINTEIRRLILESLQQNVPVNILSFADSGLLTYGGYSISLTAGLKDSLINEIQPPWNLINENTRVEVANFDTPPDIRGALPAIPSIPVNLGIAAYNQGFFNVAVEHDHLFGNNLDPIRIQMGDNIIQGYINRTANPNNTPRIMGGIQMTNWIQENFDQYDVMNIDVMDPAYVMLNAM